MSLTRAPAAPTKARRPLTSTRTPTARSRNNEDQDPNALAHQLDKTLKISYKSSLTTRISSAPIKRAPASAGQHALKPTTPALGSRPPKQPTMSPTDRAKQAMKVVNASLQALASSSKSGWRTSADAGTPRSTSSTSRAGSTSRLKEASPATTATTTSSSSSTCRELVQAEATACAKALSELRQLIRDKAIPSKSTDIEKAAASLVANLVEMEMLASMHASIASWFSGGIPISSPLGTPTSNLNSMSSFAFLYSLPMPTSLTLDSSIGSINEVISLVLAVQQYTVACLFRSQLDEAESRKRNDNLHKVIKAGGTPIEWRKLLDNTIQQVTLPQDQMDATVRKADAMLTSIFGTVTKACIGADTYTDPAVLLDVRLHVLLTFGHTRALYVGPEKMASFLEQARKILLLFGRQAEQRGQTDSKINELVKKGFNDIVQLLGEHDVAKTGKMWTSLCEVVQHIAKRVDDVVTVERVSILLDSDEASSSTTPEQRADQLCAKLVNATSMLDLYLKKKSDDPTIISQAERAITFLQALEQLRINLTTQKAWFDIDKNVERLRYVIVRHVRAGTQRLDQLARTASTNQDIDNEPSSSKARLLQVLEALINFEEVVKKGLSQHNTLPVNTSTIDAAVETCVILAYSRLDVARHESFPRVAAALKSAENLLRAQDHLDLSAHLSIKFLASSSYNVGGMLFNASKPEAAIQFVQQSCDLTKAAAAGDEEDDDDEAIVDNFQKLSIQDDNEEGRKSRSESIKDIQRHAAKRWELLALCRHSIGDRKLALEAFRAAILAQALNEAEGLAQDFIKNPASELSESRPFLFRLVQRFTKLATVELLFDSDTISLFTEATANQLDQKAAALLVEMQVLSLQTHVDKPEAQAAVAKLAQELSMEYSVLDSSMRRARVLLWQLEYGFVASSSSEFRQAILAAEQVRALCAEATRRDEPLNRFCQQYIALSHLWTAVRAHGCNEPNDGERLAEEAKMAIKALQALLHVSKPSNPQKTSPARSSSKSSKTAVSTKDEARSVPPRTTRARGTDLTTTRKTPARATTIKSAQTTQTPGRKAQQTTPPRKRPMDLLERTAKESTRGHPDIDDVGHLVHALTLISNLLSALGFNVIRMSYLRLLCRLCKSDNHSRPSTYLQTAAQLAQEHMRVGRYRTATVLLEQVSQNINKGERENEAALATARVDFLLARAILRAELGEHEASAHDYQAALDLADTIDSDELHPSISTRIRGRTLLLQRAAMAASSCSIALCRRGELVRAMEPAMQSMRLWTRALANLNRLDARTDKKLTRTNANENVQDAFDDTRKNATESLPEYPAGSSKCYSVLNNGIHSSLAWQMAQGMGQAILDVASLNDVRGTPKAAEHYATAAIDFAQDIQSPGLEAKALAIRASIRAKLGRMTQAGDDLQTMRNILGEDPSEELLRCFLLGADLSLRQGEESDAQKLYEASQEVFDQLQVISGEALPALSETSGQRRQSAEALLPREQAALLRTQTRLLNSAPTIQESLLHQLSRVSVAQSDKVAETLIRATRLFEDMLRRSVSDPVLGILPESVLSVPAFCSPASTSVRISLPKHNPESQATMLQEADALLVRALTLAAGRAEPAQMREISLLHAAFSSLYQSVTRSGKVSADSVARVLDLGVAVTLRRDMYEAVERRLSDSARHDDLRWPSLDLDDSSDGKNKSIDNAEYWLGLRDRYRSESHEHSSSGQNLCDVLPCSWSAVSLHLSASRDCLIITRHERGSKPIIVRAPLDRIARREGEEESMSYDMAIGELRDIISASNRGTQEAKNVEGKAGRAAWWAERKELDVRLKTLLEAIENEWLAAFKGTLLQAHFDDTAFDTFAAQIDTILKRSIVRAAQDKRSSRFKVNQDILKALAALSPTARDEDFEDLYHFVMESFQLCGIPAACDEADVDQIVLDLRTAFEDLHANMSPEQGRGQASDETHLLLVLDKTLQAFPWESLPCLRGKSVSRVPSLSFVLDRLELITGGRSDSFATKNGRITVNTSKTSFVLNPGTDLTATQKVFEPWLEHQRQTLNWNGIVARAPSDEEVRHALSNSDLMLYFGHGGAEQYVRSQTVKHVTPRCATTMLWGCSSGTLKSQGDYELVGTPYHYLVGGCPALVANLWDVTDKDIDKFAVSVFEKIGIWTDVTTARTDKLESGDKVNEQISLTTAVAASREVPLLKYLNGAAPVVYGVPVWFS
ncbi:separin protein [Microbotryomycetes sp. JL221]|nr:separin protein [Microbotryomycetes sp. JL221]